MLFTKEIQYLKKNIDLNDIYYCTLSRTNYGIIRNDCSVLEDLSSHDLAIIQYLFGKDIKIINATSGKYISDKYDEININMKVDNIHINVHTSWMDHDKKRYLNIIGKNKTYCINFNNQFESIKIINTVINSSDEIIHKTIDIPTLDQEEPLKNVVLAFYNYIKFNKDPISEIKFAVSIDNIIDTINNIL